MTDAVDTSAEAVERRAKRMEAAALVYKERAPCCGEGRIGGVCRAPACHFGEVMGGLQGGAATLRALAAERDAAVARAERWDTEAAAARIAIPRIEAERDAAQAEAKRLQEALDEANKTVRVLRQEDAIDVAEHEALQAEAARLREALKWTGEVYPETRPESGGAVVHMTWEEFNRMRELIGLPRRKPRPARAALAKEADSDR